MRLGDFFFKFEYSNFTLNLSEIICLPKEYVPDKTGQLLLNGFLGKNECLLWSFGHSSCDFQHVILIP